MPTRPAREANPQRSGRDFSDQQQSLGQQRSMTLDEIPELPAGKTPRSETEPIAEGFTKEDADLSERTAIVLNEGCQTYWPSPYAVCGEIRNKYNAMGGPASFLSFPKSPEYQNPGATGFRSEFVNGSLYWSPSSGAHPVTLLYMSKWADHGWETGMMGYPTNDEIGNTDGEGSHQEFQGAGTYWHPIAGINNIGGAIRGKWDTVGSYTSGGLLGYPVTDETILPDGLGRMNRFQRGVIYWSPSTGAQFVNGDILAKWTISGFENGSYGYPTSDPVDNWVEVEQDFQGGRISTAGAGALELALTTEYLTAEQALADAYDIANSSGANIVDTVTSLIDGVRSEARSGTSGPMIDVPEARGFGDLFMSDSISFRYVNHGHMGIFLTKTGTIESLGVGKYTQFIDNETAGDLGGHASFPA